MVGRSAQQAEFQSLLKAASAGQGRLVAVQGEPGSGKTRLARWLTNRADEDGTPVAWGVCAHAGSAPPFSPWSQLLRKLVRQHKQPFPPHLGALGDLVPEIGVPRLAPPDDAQHARFALFSAVVDLLRELTLEGPIVVVLDDIQDADIGSLRLLVHLAPHLYDLPILLVCTRRTIGSRTSPEQDELLEELSVEWREVTVPPLGQDDLMEYIQAVTGTDPDPDVAATIVARTGGNPFFVDRVVRALVTESGALPEGIPASVRALVSRRLRSLGAAAKSVLAPLAILRRPASPGLIAAICEEPLASVLAVFDAATREGLIEGAPERPGDYVFRHDLVRSAIFDGIQPLARAKLQARTALAILAREGDASPALTAEVARLWASAAVLGPEEREQAYLYSRRAGDQAMRVASWETAAEWFAQADLFGGHPEQRPAILVQLGRAQVACGSMDAARESFTEAIDLSRERQDYETLASAALGFAETGDAGIVDHEKLSLLREAERLLPRSAGDQRALLLSRAARELWLDAELKDLREELSEAALEAARGVSPQTLVTVLDARLLANGGPDGLPELLESVKELDRLMDDIGTTAELVARRWRLNAMVQTGRTQAALAEVAAYERCAKRTHIPRYLYNAALRRCFHPFLAGQIAESIELIDVAREAGLRAGEIHASAAWCMGRSIVCLHSDLENVERIAEDIRTHVERLRVPAYRATLVLLLLRAGDEAGAREALRPILERGLDGIPWNMFTLATFALLSQVALDLEDRDLALGLLERQAPYTNQAARLGSYLPLGATASHAGRLAAFLGDPRADALLAQGRELNSAMGARIFLRDHPIAPVPGRPQMRTPAPSSSAARVAVLSRGADVWTLKTQGGQHHMRPSRGLDYLETLLGNPEVDHLAADLAGVAAPLRDQGAGPALDDAAKKAYRERARELRLELAEAEADNDLGRIDRARAELEFLTAELTGAIGLGGRDRPNHSSVERARSAVTRAIRRATKNIGAFDAELGRHLDATIRTGHRCCYEPSPLFEIRLENPSR